MEIKKSKISENNINTKVNQLNENKSCNELSLRRDSFSDRFCDDLSEVLLSFVSFEDKIRFECVSHQFQRLLFNKQHVLQVFYFTLKTKNSLTQLLKEIRMDLSFINEIDLIAFESVLKKCKFINKIVIKSEDIECENSLKVLQLIAKYVKHLKSIEFDFKDINEKVFLEFGEKCGQKLEYIHFKNRSNYMNSKYNKFLKLCPNIRSINNIRLSDMIENNDLLVPKLTSIKRLRLNSDIILFKTLVKKTENSLKCLEIHDIDTEQNEVVLKLLKNVFFDVSKFVNLEELYLSFECMTDEDFAPLRNAFHCIGYNCKKVKKLTLFLDEDCFGDQSIDFFTTFTQLKHLSLNFWSILDIKSLQNCKQLTHLSFSADEKHKNHFNDVDLYLPQLTHFECCIDCDITDDELKPLSKLKHLQCLEIDSIISDSCSLTDEGICQIINNCPQITSIRLNKRPNITHKTIDALISLAEKKPFCDFLHSFGSKPYKTEEDFDYLEFLTNKKYEILPKNLGINPLHSQNVEFI